MEQARNWMSLTKQTHEDVDGSWEERAFAEDAAGMLGGCVWPPRSYTCNFCRREFRSAQALGGHMNVHRRDRAKLKQFSCPPNDQMLNPCPNNIDSYHNNPVSSYSSLPVSYPTHRNDHDYSWVNESPNPDPNNPNAVSISHNYISTPSREINWSKQRLIPYFPSFLLNHKRNPFFLSPNVELGSKSKELGCDNENLLDKSSLSISLVFQQNHPIADDDEDSPGNPKRRKSHAPSEPNREDKVYDHLSKVHSFKSTSLEELDLELRLGDRPKVH